VRVAGDWGVDFWGQDGGGKKAGRNGLNLVLDRRRRKPLDKGSASSNFFGGCV